MIISHTDDINNGSEATQIVEIKQKICPFCETENDEEMKFCMSCGKEMTYDSDIKGMTDEEKNQ